MLKKIAIDQKVLIPYEKVYKSGKSVKVLENEVYTKVMKINSNKVMMCCKFPDSRGMILAILFTCQTKKDNQSMNCKCPHLEGFLSN
jgi:hypothetical protein